MKKEKISKAFVVGWPIDHSRSPIIHRYWLEKYCISGSYEPVSVRSTEICDFIRTMEAKEYIGGNVTIPHKETILSCLDEIDDVAKTIGAVNTVWIENGRIFGTNTDAYGFLRNLDEKAPHWGRSTKWATVLGAGGAARAIVYGLLDRGFENVGIVNRTVSRAKALSREFGPRVSAYPWSRIPEVLKETELLVNATSLGMVGRPPLDIDLEPLSRSAVVSDIVYVPILTNFLQAALSRGNVAVDGLGMLLHQAVPGFRKWFGITPTVTDELRALVIGDMERNE